MNFFRLLLVVLTALFVYMNKGSPKKSWNFTYYAVVRVIRSILQVPDTNDTARLVKHLNRIRKQLDKNFVSFEQLKKRKQFKSIFYGELEIDRLDNELVGMYPVDSPLPESPRQFYAEWDYVNNGSPAGNIEDLEQILSNEAIKIVLFCHGGAYTLMSPKSHRFMTAQISRYTGFAVLSIDYRLAPEYPFPAGLFDAIAAFIWLCRKGVSPSRIVLAGDSAGGGLTFALMLFLRDYRDKFNQIFNIDSHGIFAYIGLSPWLDLTMDGASIGLNSSCDYLTSPQELHGINSAWLYVGGMGLIPRMRDADIKQEMDIVIKGNPYISPVYSKASFDNLPPILMISGGAELILSDTLLMYGLVSGQIISGELDDIHQSPWLLETTTNVVDWDKAATANMSSCSKLCSNDGVNKIRVEIYHDQIHVFLAFPMVKCRRLAYENLRSWTESLTIQNGPVEDGLFVVY